jgi:hypothetical protein
MSRRCSSVSPHKSAMAKNVLSPGALSLRQFAEENRDPEKVLTAMDLARFQIFP